MIVETSRSDFQKLTDLRMKESQLLLNQKDWDGAYYLAGYALECALKACVMKYVEQTGVIFEDKKYGKKCWTHDLDELFRLAGLTVVRNQAISNNPQLRQNWTVASSWSEASRYRFIAQLMSENLINATNDPADGVLTWLKNYW